MIDLVVSKFPNAKSNCIYKKIEKDINKNIKSFIIVPEQYTLQTDIEFIEAISFDTVMDAKVLSFNSFSRFIIDRLGGDKEEILTPNAKIMLLSTILEDMSKELDVFSDNYRDVDFLENLSKTIGEIKENKIFDKGLDLIEDSGLSKELSMKISDIEKIYKEYNNRLADKFVDSEDRLDSVINKLDKADFLKGSKFYFHKFDNFSDLKLELIKKLSNIGADIYITSTLDSYYMDKMDQNDLEMFDNAYKLRDRIGRVYVGQIHKLDDPDYDGDFCDDYYTDYSPEISHLLNNFERYDYDTRGSQGLKPIKTEIKNIEGEDVTIHKYENIDIYSNPSTSKEVENAGLFIKENVIKEGKRFRDFSLYVSDMDEFENQIIRTFSRNNIPYFMDEISKLSQNHIIKTYLTGLRLVIDDYKIDDLKYFVTSNIVDFGNNQNLKVANLLNFLDERKIIRKMFVVDKYFVMDKEYYKSIYKNNEFLYKTTENEFNNIAEIRHKILALLDGLYHIRDEKISARKLCIKIYDFITDEIFRKGIQRYQSVLEEYSFTEKIQHNQQAIDKFVDILDQLVLVLGDRKVNLKTIYKLIEAATTNTKIAAIPPSKDHVTISELKRSSIANRPINMVLGLNNAYFPAINSNKKIFTSNEINTLKSSNIDIDLDIVIEDIEQAELRDLYKIFTYSDYLYLSYSKGDKTGERLEKASVLNQISQIFSNILEVDTVGYGPDKLRYSLDLSQKYALDIIRSDNSSKNPDEDELDFIKSLTSFIYNNEYDDNPIQLLTNYELIRQGLTYTSDKANLDPMIAEKMFNKNKWSASQIDKYARCPYQHYVSYGINPVESMDYNISALDEGNIVHKIFEDVTKLLEGENDISKLEIDREKFDQILRENIDDIRLEDPRNKFIIDNIWENTNKNFGYLKTQFEHTDFKVRAVEVDFDIDSKGLYPAVKLDDGNYLTGRIDRVDELDLGDKTYTRVVDYKTGNKTFKITNILNFLDFQLVIYIMSVKSSDEYIPLGAFYLPLQENISPLKGQYKLDKIKDIDFKNHRLDGLITDYLSEKDKKDIEQILNAFHKGASKVRSVKSTKISYEKDILSADQADGLMDFVKKSTIDMISEIKAGDIKLNPVVDGDPTCRYCSYNGICKIDPSLDEDKYRKLVSYELDENGNRVLKGESNHEKN